MWVLDNQTPFAAESAWVRDENGAELWLVAVKGSFVLGDDGTQALAPEQCAVSLAPEFRGAPENSSLHGECDLVHTKICTDVLVDGLAHAPHGLPTDLVDVRLKLANIDKTLRVYGDRVIENSLVGVKLSAPQPFTTMPITYERSFGGTDAKDENPKRHAWEPRNPVGVGFGTAKGHVVGTMAPNIETPKGAYDDWQRGEPAGFGPIARHWMPRVQFAGTYDERWEQTRNPLLPADFDERFYQSAPQDQQADGFLRGGEVVELYNLGPVNFYSFPLPRIKLGMTTWFYDGTKTNHSASLHTVLLQPHKRSFQMTWHSALPCHNKVNKLEVTRILIKKRIGNRRTATNNGMWSA